MRKFGGMIPFLLLFGCFPCGILNAGDTPSTRPGERAVPPYQEVSEGFHKSLHSILDHSRASLYAGNSKKTADNPPRKSASGMTSPKKSYAKALALYEQKHYDQSRAAFTAFLEKFPDHSLSDNAWYWTGECYYAEDRYDKAFESFKAVLDRFPKSNKRPDALLKMGLCCGEFCQAEEGRIYWQQVIDKYPRTPSAALARKYLAR